MGLSIFDSIQESVTVRGSNQDEMITFRALERVNSTPVPTPGVMGSR